MPPPAPPHSPLNRTQVHTAFAKLLPRLTPAVKSMAEQLRDALADDGSVSVKALHDKLFPLADTRGASAQLLTLLKRLVAAAEEAGVRLEPAYDGAKQAGVAQRRLRFEGPRPALQADTEGLDAIPPGRPIDGQRGMPLEPLARIALIAFNDHEFKAVVDAFWAGTEPPPPVDVGGISAHQLGEHGNAEVWLRHSPQGSRESQRSAADVARAWQPDAVVAVGIAFGFDDKK